MTEILKKYDLKTRVQVEFVKKSQKMTPHELAHHSKAVNKVQFNKAGTVFATCADDNFIHFYSSINYQLIRSIKMQNAVKNIAFFKKEHKIVVANALGTFEIYEYFSVDDKPFYSYKNNDKRILSMSLSYGDKYLAILTKSITEPFSKVNCHIYEVANLVYDEFNTFLTAVCSIESEVDQNFN